MAFYADPLPVPDGLVNGEFVLEPLTTEHVYMDLAALMDSRETLRAWSGTSWPSDEFTVEENRADLDRHAQEHVRRKAFTFTVLDPTRTECLGCVYIEPLTMAARGAFDPTRGLTAETATVSFWVRSPRETDGLDRRLVAALQRWFVSSWRFPTMYVCVRDGFRQQWGMLESQGLPLAATVSVSGRDPVRLYSIG